MCWLKDSLRKKPWARIGNETTSRVLRPVDAHILRLTEIGELYWDAEHNSEQLTVHSDGRTIEWDQRKSTKARLLPQWVPASTRLFLHSGEFSLDFRIDNMAGGQMGVGFLLQVTDGVEVGCDWGSFGYLGSSCTAWAYDPSTGDLVTGTRSIEGDLPQCTEDNGHTIRLTVTVPRHRSGFARFTIGGVDSHAIALPAGAVIVPAACLMSPGQRVTLMSFEMSPRRRSV